MSFKFNISEILNNFDLTDREKSNLVRLFEFTNYLYDDEENLTKTFNLVKDAKSKLIERIREMFESEFKEDQERLNEESTETVQDTSIKEDNTYKEDTTKKSEE